MKNFPTTKRRESDTRETIQAWIGVAVEVLMSSVASAAAVTVVVVVVERMLWLCRAPMRALLVVLHKLPVRRKRVA